MYYVLIPLAAVALIVLRFLVWLGIQKRRIRERIREHISGHPSMPQEQYLGGSQLVGKAGEAAVRLRGVMADLLGVPVDTIHPPDTLEYLCSLSVVGFDDFDFTAMIERLVGKPRVAEGKVAFGRAFADCEDVRHMTFAEFSRRVVDNWPELAEHEKPSV